MARVKISGYMEMIEVPNEDAKRIRRELPHLQKQDAWVEIGTFNGKARQIIAIILDEESLYRTDPLMEQDRKYHRQREELLEKPPTERLDLPVGLFKLLYSTMFETEPSREMIQKVEQETLEFLKQNPSRLYPDVTLYRQFFEATDNVKVRSTFHQSGFHLVGLIIANDIYEANIKETLLALKA